MISAKSFFFSERPESVFSAEQIITKLREAEVELAKGQTTAEACRKLTATEQTYYRWPKESGGLRVDQATRQRRLKENERVKRLITDQALDIAILKEVWARQWHRR